MKKYENYCGETCRIAARKAYNKWYFSDPLKKVEVALRRKLRETPEQRAHKAGLARERYDRYAAFVTLHLRRAKAQGVCVVPFTAADLESRMAMFGFSCWICHGPFEAIDHVKPLAAGGGHMLSNFRPICRDCNLRKHAIWPLSVVVRKFTIWAELTGYEGELTSVFRAVA